MINYKKITIGFILAMLIFGFSNSKATNTQHNQLFDFGWKFFLGDNPNASKSDFNDSKWRSVDLPHDWSIEGHFDQNNPAGNDGGYLPTGIGWYRKTFTPAIEDSDQIIGLYFEGVYMNSEVFINGQFVGKYPYGYSPFFYDITSYVQFGKPNTIAVRVDNSQQKNCRWYSGSGIYRHVWLIKKQQVHIDQWGVGITTPQVTSQKAKVQLNVTLKNEISSDQGVNLKITLKRHNISVGEDQYTIQIPSKSSKNIIRTIEVEHPELWSPDSPQLYEARVEILQGDKALDSMTESFGIRTIEYSTEEGLKLNGKSLLLTGGCLHHDNGCLGSASFDRAEERKVELMKKAGFNAVRTSHNLPSEAFLHACDRLGLLVIDEAFDGWRDEKNPHDYSVLFDKWWKKDIQSMVLRDRNHPSIFCWSIGNEVIERKKLEVVTTAKKLRDAIREIDITRPITSALASWDKDWDIYDPLAEVHDIVGYNYLIHHAESDHQRVPSRVMVQTESYPRDAFSNWKKVNQLPYVIGDFVWTSIDYLGESGIGRYYYEGDSEGEHYERNQFPWHGAYCGDIDLIGWRKPISHYREMLYNPKTNIYMAVKEPDGYYGKIKVTSWSVWPTWESWSWPGHEGKDIEVEVYARTPKVRLYLNDQLIGEKSTGIEQEFKAVFKLPYKQGTLRAVGVNGTIEDPSNICILESASKPNAIRMNADRKVINANGQDLSFISVDIIDSKSIVNPNADNLISFEVKGAGTLIAVCNANIKDSSSYQDTKCNAWKGKAMIVIRSNGKKGKISIRANSPKLKSSEISIHAR